MLFSTTNILYILAYLEICFNIPANNIIVFTFQIDVFYDITNNIK